MHGQYVSASCVGFGGMTLRDYFAAKAMVAIRTGLKRGEVPPADVARWAYDYADAMLAARKGGGA